MERSTFTRQQYCVTSLLVCCRDRATGKKRWWNRPCFARFSSSIPIINSFLPTLDFFAPLAISAARTETFWGSFDVRRKKNVENDFLVVHYSRNIVNYRSPKDTRIMYRSVRAVLIVSLETGLTLNRWIEIFGILECVHCEYNFGDWLTYYKISCLLKKTSQNSMDSFKRRALAKWKAKLNFCHFERYDSIIGNSIVFEVAWFREY